MINEIDINIILFIVNLKLVYNVQYVLKVRIYNLYGSEVNFSSFLQHFWFDQVFDVLLVLQY